MSVRGIASRASANSSYLNGVTPVKKKRSALTAVLILFVFFCASGAHAHSIELTYRRVGKDIEITARYDTGTPVGGAAADVFAPDDPAVPRLQGETDSNGVYVFTPDRSRPGQWMVRVRQDGHGGMVYIPVGRWALIETIPPMHALAVLATIFFLGASLWLNRLSSKLK